MRKPIALGFARNPRPHLHQAREVVGTVGMARDGFMLRIDGWPSTICPDNTTDAGA